MVLEVETLTATGLAREVLSGLTRIEDDLFTELSRLAAEGDLEGAEGLLKIEVMAALCVATARALIESPAARSPGEALIVAASEAWDQARRVYDDGDPVAEIQRDLAALHEALEDLSSPTRRRRISRTRHLHSKARDEDVEIGMAVGLPTDIGDRELRSSRSGAREAMANRAAPSAPSKPSTLVQRIFLGTDRAPDGGETGGFGKHRNGRLTLAEYRVSVPTARKRGAIPRPGKFLIWGGKADKERHIMLASGPEILDEAEFLTRVDAEDSGDAAFLFVHGYNSPFANGLYRTAQLAIDLEVRGPVFHYSWPSAGSPFLYDYDEDSVGEAQEHLKAFLELIVDRAGLTRLNVIAHSKGNDLVLHTLRLMAAGRKTLTTGELVMASPDINVGEARNIIPRLVGLFNGMTLYASRRDRPLKWSAGKAVGTLRAGSLLEDGAPLIVDGADSIDAGDQSFAWFGLNHDAYVAAPTLRNDIKALFAEGTRPVHRRTPSFLLRNTPRAPYWRPDED